MNRSLLVRMIALLVVVLGGFTYIAFDVVGWRIGAQDYRVTVMMPSAGGIYTEGDVTYRGVTVGRVIKLGLEPDAVAVEVEIRPGIKIPADTLAQVRELSAAGEQYLDFVPQSSTGPYLHNGSVIAADRTSVPIPISEVLADTSNLLRSINPAELNTVTQALATGFGGNGEDLRNIVVAGQNLVAALQAAAPATVELLVGAHTVLKGAVATDKAFGQFATGLDQLSSQLKTSNGDLNALLDNGISAEQQAGRLLSQYSLPLESLLKNAGTVSSVTAAEQPEVQELFQVLPIFAGRIGTVVSGGQLHVELYFNTDDPVCPYISGSQAALPTQTTGAPDLDRTCGLSTPGALERGAGWAP